MARGVGEGLAGSDGELLLLPDGHDLLGHCSTNRTQTGTQNPSRTSRTSTSHHDESAGRLADWEVLRSPLWQRLHYLCPNKQRPADEAIVLIGLVKALGLVNEEPLVNASLQVTPGRAKGGGRETHL